MGKEGSEARRKKDNKQAEERKEKTSTQKHKPEKKKKQQEYIQQEKQTKQNKLFTNLKLKKQERERERRKQRQKREMVGGTQGRAVTRKEEEEEEGKDVGTRDQTASGTGALERVKMQRGRKEETEKSVTMVRTKRLETIIYKILRD